MRYILHTKAKADIAETKFIPLSTNEMRQGCEIRMDSGTNSCVAVEHAWISETVEGLTVSAKGFSDSLPVEENLPIINNVYAYNRHGTGEVLLLEINHCIYTQQKGLQYYQFQVFLSLVPL